MFETLDTTGMAHTSKNLAKLAEDSMVKNVVKYGFKVCGFVTDNAANEHKYEEDSFRRCPRSGINVWMLSTHSQLTDERFSSQKCTR